MHWLPVQQRIDFKILVHVYNCITATAPPYLRTLLTIYEPGRPGLRPSSDMLRLAVPPTKRATGESAFSVLGPRLWNSLPLKLRQASSVCIFKKRLKTYLFPKL